MAINIYSGAKKKRNEQQTAKQITAFPVTAAYVASKQSGSAAQSANKTATQTTGGQSGANTIRPTPLNIAADAVRERYNAQRSITTPSAASSIVSTAQTNPIRPTPLNIALESAADANKNLTYLEARKRSLESDLAGWLVDEEDRKAWTEELASIEQQIAESKAARQRLGMNEEAPTFWQRLGNVGKAAAAGTGADYASMAGTWREAGMNTSGDIVNTALENYRKEQAREQSIIDAYEAGTGEYTEADYEEALRQKEYLQFYIDAYAKASGVEEQAPELFRQTANDLAEVSAQETEKAKEGLGTVGQLLADAGVAGVQMITDTATSGGASAMPSMMARVFGGKAREGQEKGYSVQKQVATGAAAATISFLTEMLGENPLMGENGGIIDDVISRYLAPNSPAVAKLMDIPANALGEGLEEVAENILTELSDYLIAGDSVEISAAELGREGLIGALLGGAGQIAGTAVNTAARAMSNNATGQIGKTETENAAPEGDVESTSVNDNPAIHDNQKSQKKTGGVPQSPGVTSPLDTSETASTVTPPVGANITQPVRSVNRFPSPITDAIEAAETAEVPIDQAGIYGRSVGAAVPLKGKLVESRTNLLEDLNLSEQARQQIYENTLPHERVSESLAGERAAANYEVRDSDGRLLNLNDIVWELKEKAEKFSQVGPEEVKAAERALVNLQHEAQQTGNWTNFRRFNSEVVQTLKTTSGQTLQAWAEFSRTPAHMVAEAMDIMDAAVEAADDVDAAAQRDETATKIAEDAEAIQQAVDSENAASLRELIRQISTERGYAPSKGVSDALEKIQSMETLQEMATMASYGRALDMLPESFAKKLGTWQTTAHLLNPKTLLRNYIANTVFAPVDTVAHDVGLFTDFVLALIQSGEGKGSVKQNRTVGFENPFTKRDAEYVAAARARNALDIREDKGGKYFAGGRVFDRNGNGFNRAMNRAEGALGWGLNVTDAMQKAKSKAQSEQALKGLVESGGKVTQDVANRITDQEMLYRSFQRSTGIGDALQGIKDVLNIAGFGAETKRLKGQYSVREFGLGDLTTKYTTVPGALIHTAADYTPLAAFNVARDIAAMVKFNRAEGDAKTETMRGQYQGMTNAEAAAMAQYNAAVGMGRLLTGSGIMMIGAMAVRAGLVGFRPYDRDEREEYAARSALGESGLQLNINAAARWFAGQGGEWKDGDLLMDLGQFQPIDTLIKIAAVIEDEDDEKWSRAIDAVVDGLASSIEELNMMQTARTVINDFRYRSDDETAWETAKQIGLDILSGAATGFIPGPVRNLATALDRYKRDTSADTAAQELLNKMIAAIPGLRNTLPAKLDYTGQPLENENALLRTLNAQVLPMTVNTYKEDEVLDYLDSLPDGSTLYPDVYAPSSFSNNGVDYTLNTEQQREYLTTYRQTYYSLAQEFSGNSFTTAMSEELQRETLKDLNAFAAQEAKRQAVEAAGGEYKRTSYNYLYDDNGELMFEDPGSVIALRNAYNNMVDSDYQDSADFEKMYGWFQNQGDGAGWMSNTLHGEQLKIAEAIGGLEKMAVCIRAGMTPQEYGEAKAYHDELNRDENLSPSARATDFAYWLSKQGFSSRELAAAKSTLTFSFGGVVSAEKYEELTESGISASDSNKVFDAVDALEVEDGYSTVRDVQRYEAIAGLNGMSEEDKLTAIGVYAGTNSSTYAYYKAAYDCGVELSEYVSVLRDIESYQKDRNKSTSSVSQGELYLALYYADITEQQRQYIYYVYATQKGWKNTSYNGAASAGTEVYREVLAARTQ